MSGMITCRCGMRQQFTVADDVAKPTEFRRALEVRADEHERANVRRAYRHDAAVEVTR